METTLHSSKKDADSDLEINQIQSLPLEEPKTPTSGAITSNKRAFYIETASLTAAFVLLIILFWGFFVGTAYKPLYISNTTAAIVLAYFPSATAILTSISTVCNMLVCYLYARTVRLAALKSLTNTLEVRSLVGWHAVMGKKLLGVPLGTGSHWSKVALASYLLLWALTSGFSVSITPRPLTQTKSLPPFGELDMSSDAFLNKVYTPMSEKLPCRYGNYSFFTCSKSQPPQPRQPPLFLEAGEASAFQEIGYPVSTNFADATINGTSKGVMPIGAYNFSLWFANDSSPLDDFTKAQTTAWNIQTYNISYQQLGLTADITCYFDDSSPLAANPVADINVNATLMNATISCDGTNLTPLSQQVVGTDFVLASFCSDANQTQRIYLRGFGAYETDPENHTPVIANITCHLNPVFAMYDVVYQRIFEAPDVGPNALTRTPALQNSNSTLIQDITATLVEGCLKGQSILGNTFVDTARSIALSNTGLRVEPSMNHVIQWMFQGMFEISGLAINGYWSSQLFENATSQTLLQSPYIREVGGTLTIEFFGWQGNASAAAGLIPFTAVAIISLIMLRSIWSGGSDLPTKFDPSNPFHLVIASSTGHFDKLGNVDLNKDC